MYVGAARHSLSLARRQGGTYFGCAVHLGRREGKALSSQRSAHHMQCSLNEGRLGRRTEPCRAAPRSDTYTLFCFVSFSLSVVDYVTCWAVRN